MLCQVFRCGFSWVVDGKRHMGACFDCLLLALLSCSLTSTEARWPIRDGDRVGRGRESERLDYGNRP